MLSVPEVYQQGMDRGSNFTGVILKIDGLDLFGNVETEFSDGHVYNVIKSWSGINQSINVFDNTYSKPAPKFKLSNVAYRNGNRPSDYMQNIVGNEAIIYFVNSEAANSLSDCLQPFIGTVESVSEYDSKEISVELMFKGALADAKILTSDGEGSLKGFIDTDTIPDATKDEAVPVVYGDFVENLTGLVKGYRYDRDEPRFLFSDHPVKSVGGLYLSNGDDTRAAMASNSNPTRDPYAAILFETPYETNLLWHLSDEIESKIQNWTAPNYCVQSTAWKVNDGLPEYLTDNGVETQVEVVSSIRNSAQESGAVAWTIIDPNDDFRTVINNTSDNYYISITFANMQVIEYPEKQRWRLWYNQDLTKFLRFLNQWPTTGMFGVDDHDELNDELGMNWHNTQEISKEAFKHTLGDDLMNMLPVIGHETVTYKTIPSDHIVALIGAALLRMRFPYKDKIVIDPTKNSALLTAWASMQGRYYGSWANNFTNIFNGSTGGLTLYRIHDSIPDGRLIESGAGILASLFIDRPTGEELLSANSNDFDLASFGHNLFNGVRMRLNVLDKDATINKVAKQLGDQAPWTFVFTASGRAKLVSTRKVFTDGYLLNNSSLIKYHELKDGLKIGLTPDKNVVNHLTIKSRWYGEQNAYKDEEIVENLDSQNQYGKRKKTVEWPNICNENNPISTSVGTPKGIGETGAQDGANSMPIYIDDPRSDAHASTIGYEPIDNPVAYMRDFLLSDQDGTDKGLLSHQHHMLSKIVIPGTSRLAFEVGDRMAVEDAGFAARNITVFGESFDDKIWLITDLKFNEKQMTINKAMQMRTRRILPTPPDHEPDGYTDPFAS